MNTAFATAIMVLTQAAVGADLSRTPPIIAFHTMLGIPVGADLSRTPPIYRPSSPRHYKRSSTPTEMNP